MADPGGQAGEQDTEHGEQAEHQQRDGGDAAEQELMARARVGQGAEVELAVELAGEEFLEEKS